MLHRLKEGHTILMPITKVISGGQTGADQAGLRAARAFGIPTGGYAPREWTTESGPAPWLADFGLVECPKPTDKTRDAVEGWLYRSICYAERTKANATESDATLWFEMGEKDSKGFECTKKAAVGAGNPIYVVERGDRMPDATVGFLKQYWNFKAIEVLNVAGNRESKSSGIEAWVFGYLCEVFELLGHKRAYA